MRVRPEMANRQRRRRALVLSALGLTLVPMPFAHRALLASGRVSLD